MRKLFRALLVAALSAVGLLSTPLIIVTPAVAPNRYGSPSYSAWVSNAIAAIGSGSATYGTPGTPSYYQAAPFVIPEAWDLVTSFYSWLGVADPGATFGPDFVNELGNRILFGIHILGNGTKFAISDLSFAASSTDSADLLGFSYGAGSYNYGADYVGIIYGTPNILVTSGPNTQLVDELIGRGSGNALWPCGPGDPLPCSTPDEQQAALNWWANYNGAPYYFNGTYTLNYLDSDSVLSSVQGEGGVEFDPVPEPGTLFLVAALLVLFGKLRSQRPQ